MGRNCQIVGMDWNRIARLHSHVLGSYELTASHLTSRHFKMRPTNLLSEYTIEKQQQHDVT